METCGQKEKIVSRPQLLPSNAKFNHFLVGVTKFQFYESGQDEIGPGLTTHLWFSSMLVWQCGSYYLYFCLNLGWFIYFFFNGKFFFASIALILSHSFLIFPAWIIFSFSFFFIIPVTAILYFFLALLGSFFFNLSYLFFPGCFNFIFIFIFYFFYQF